MCSIIEIKPRRVTVSCKQLFNDNESSSSKLTVTSPSYSKVLSSSMSTTSSSNRQQTASYQGYYNNDTTSYCPSYNNNDELYYPKRNNNFNYSHETHYQPSQKHRPQSHLYNTTNDQTVYDLSYRDLHVDTIPYHSMDILFSELANIDENAKQNKATTTISKTSLNPLSPAFHSTRQTVLISENSSSLIDQKFHYQSETSDYGTDPEQQYHHTNNHEPLLSPPSIVRLLDNDVISQKKLSTETVFKFDVSETKNSAYTSFSSSSSGYQEEHDFDSISSCRRVSSSSSMSSSCSSLSSSETYSNSQKYSTSKSCKINIKQRTNDKFILTSSSMDESNSDEVIIDENEQQNQCFCEKENYSKKKQQQFQQRKSIIQRKLASSYPCEKCESKRKLTFHDSTSIKNNNHYNKQSQSDEENEKQLQSVSVSNQRTSKNSSSSSSTSNAKKKLQVINDDPFDVSVNKTDFYANLTGRNIQLSIDYHDCSCLSNKLSQAISYSYLSINLPPQVYSQPQQSAFFTTQIAPIFLASSVLSTCHCQQQLLTKTLIPCYSPITTTINYLPFSSSNSLFPTTTCCKCSSSVDCVDSTIVMNNDDIIHNRPYNHYNNTEYHQYMTYENHTTNQNSTKFCIPSENLFHHDLYLTTATPSSICMDIDISESVKTAHEQQQYYLGWVTPVIDKEFLQPPPTRSWLRLSSPNVTQPTAIFTVMNYNILCDKYATRNAYGYCPSWALKWDYRRKQILEELKNYAADIIALQEIEMDQYHAYFLPELKSLGYDGVFSPKSRARTMCESDRRFVDGCAIFYRKTKFHLVENYLVEFNQLAMSAANGLSSHDMLNRVMTKDNIGLVALLETNEEIYSHTFSSGMVPADHKQLLFVCTAHIHWDPEFCDVKLVQTLMLLSEIKTIMEDAIKTHRPAMAAHSPIDCNSIPLVLCGDFNSLPDSGVIELMRNGRISLSHVDFKELQYESCLQKMSRHEGSTDLVHHFNFQSAYETNIMPYTNYTYDFKGIIDYVFYSKKLMRVLGVLGPLDPEWIRSNKIIGCPHPNVPSDHFSLLVEFELNPSLSLSTSSSTGITLPSSPITTLSHNTSSNLRPLL
ncbi:unnamed protein product [Didymodactylos carnosus]|uniref:poly(A)-specific ribonuclease n=1 Tax=Didymodactylos carnosus TaxID=1234261 RepID=A0A813NL99_9BILA|nr:unnamed protein product [Didymodactylos carnosus]CAF3518667.1 unnamed protein product [Didymodactylos carnosus]